MEYVNTGRIMYLEMRRPVHPNMLFMVPHRLTPMKAKHIIKEFPKFAEIFDGQAEENTLAFYYKKEKETGIYEFKDEASEEEVAELMGVKIYEGKDAPSEEEEAPENIKLKEEEIQRFRENMSMIREGIAWLDKDKLKKD